MDLALKGQNNQLSRVRIDLHDVVVKFSDMNRRPKYDPDRSVSKLDSWSRDIEKLTQKEQELLEEISGVKQSPAYVKEVEGKLLALATRRAKLQAELDELNDKLIVNRSEKDEAIIGGADPLKLAEEYIAMQKRADLVKLAIESVNSAENTINRWASN